MSFPGLPTIPRRAPVPQARIGDHGVIGDLRTIALVDRRGGVDWLCWPEFDGPPVFNQLLDPEGGRWEIAPSVDFEVERRYLSGTNILTTRFSTDTGVVELTDLLVMPRPEAGGLFLRTMQCKEGTVPISMRLTPTDGYSTRPGRISASSSGATIETSTVAMDLSSSVPVEVFETAVTLDMELEPGPPIILSLADNSLPNLAEKESEWRDSTVRWWRDWVGEIELPSYARDQVERSALVLKLLTHERGAQVAAPTSSLPEVVGGERNWDYRYSWLRDGSEAVLALERLCHGDEARALWQWLSDAGHREEARPSVAYTIDGERVPQEREIRELSGHRSSRPVRVGNGARDQKQLDVYGHILRAAARGHEMLDIDLEDPRAMLVSMADGAATHWDETDDSIWEIRGQSKHYLYSKLMCWAALDRAIGLHEDGALDGDAGAWRDAREKVAGAILERGWSDELESFSMTLDGDALDASALMIPVVGFLPASDHRCRATRQRVVEQLSHNGLVRRYRVNDNLEGDEGAFLLCSFWLADSFTLDDDPDRGSEIFRAGAGTANDLGLLSEEADISTGEQLGNFPQGLSHLGLIQSAVRLAEYDR